jgi:adenylate kinase
VPHGIAWFGTMASFPMPFSGRRSLAIVRSPLVDQHQKYRCILLFGMPGSGKGTQGAVLDQLPDLVHISMGDIFRKIPRSGKFGREIERFTSQGLMVPDDLTVRIFERHLMILEMQELVLPEQHTLILDGLPRSYAQAERLDSIIDVIQIFHLKIVETQKATERLRTRALRENRLDDMSEEVIHRRLQTYYDETFKTLSFFPTELICDVEAGRRAIEVLCDIVNRLAAITRN